VENVSIDNYAIPNGWQVDICDNGDGIERNGTFYVDIWLRAKGLGGILHAPGSQDIYFAMNQITMFEPGLVPVSAGPIVVQVLGRDVDVSISPSYGENLPGENLAYTVTVKNTENTGEDNYDLTVSDNAGWGDNIRLDDNQFLNVPQGGENTTKLRVHIPENATPYTNDKITVTATSRRNENIRENASCIAHVMVARGVDVSISPPDNGAWPGENATFMVTVTNMGASKDNYTLTVSDNAGWGPRLDNENLYDVPLNENRTTTLKVRIPENARTRLEDNITVIATSWTDSTVKDNASCIASSIIIRGAEVLISPENQAGLRGWTLAYTVTVWNRGSIKDNFRLENKDNLTWPMALDNVRFDNVLPGENRPTTLRVTIPDNAAACTEDNVRVIATSGENAEVSAENKCIAHLAQVTFTVSISPSFQSRFRLENLTYTVTMRNTTTDNVDFQDNYDLAISDNSGWLLSLPENRIENVGRGGENSKTFTVTIPDNAIPCTRDNVTIIATSQADNRENRSGSCIAHSLAVYVSISPPENSALPGENLTYTVKVWSTSTSSENDNFGLTVSDNENWGPSISPENVKVSAIENGTATLTVSIPENAVPCTRDNITVTATSWADNTVEDNASCIALAGYAGVSVSITPENREGFQGESLIYTVTVKNLGTITDDIGLTVQDNVDPYPSWNPTLDVENFYTVMPGGTRTTTLRVKVSWYSPPGTSDNITVRATSAENENVSAENSCIAHSKLFEVTAYPTDDAYVRSGELYRNCNYGSDNFLYVGLVGGQAARSFLKFRLPALPVGSTVENAWLYLYAWDQFPYNAGGRVQCQGVDDDGWSEGTITWSTNLPIGGLLDGPKQVMVDPAPWPNSWVVTDFVREQYQGDNIASFAMVGTGENAGENGVLDCYVKFLSKENRDYKPYLRILYNQSPSRVRVSISPSYASDFPGITENYQVTVNNIGWENSSYRLENGDNSGWPLSLDNSLLYNIPPGENRTTTLRVTIPDNAASGTEDRITVRVTSVDNESIWDENSCTARSVLPSMSISPVSYEGSRGENLTFTVTVTNPTTSPKSFNLTVRDNAGLYENWYPTLGSYKFDNVPAGGSKTTTLKVTVSWYSPQGTRDDITVRATSVGNENIRAENSCIAFSKGETGQTIGRTDAAFVWKKWPDNHLEVKDINGNPLLEVGRSENYPSRIFLKFYLSGISLPPGSKFAGGELRIETGITSGANVQCYRVDNDNWSEGSITWNNNPRIGEAISDNQWVTASYAWYEWAISSYVVEQFEKDKIVSLCMVDVGENNPPDHLANFFAGTAELVTTYSLGRYSMQVSVSPSYQSRPRGENLTYGVTVRNLGWENRNYTLSVTDNAGWGPTLENLLLDNVPPGENKAAKLRVRIPENAAPYAEDNIIITATPQDNENASASICCTVHSMVVYISITSPSVTSVVPGDNLIYTLKVWSTSTSRENDNFRLTAIDNSGWGLSISPENIKVSAIENGTATLTVTIAENAKVCTQDNITVTAIYQVNENVKDNASCTAHAGYVDLKVSISQKYQSALPGRTLDYDVTITNTGTVVENFELVEVIADNENWTWSPSRTTVKNVTPGDSKTATLTVTIPSGAAHSTTDNITLRWKATVARALSTKVVYPSDDAYVDELEKDVPHNTDTLTIFPSIYLNSSIMPWLKFENLSLPEGAENLAHARLWLYFSSHDKIGMGAGTGAYFSENDNWSENTITWDNMPSRSPTPTDSISLGTEWQSWNVTPDVLREFAGDNKASWCLKNEGTVDDYDSADAYSKEYDNGYGPYLEIIGENKERGIVYASDNCTARATHLKIMLTPSPENRGGMPGDNITFTTKIANIGLENDNYSLTVSDDAGWSNLRFDNNFFPNVPVYEERTTYLRIRIPDNATPGMKNNLKIIVTSEKDPNIFENDNCSVLVLLAAGVKVTISPSDNSGPNGATLTYAVTVNNNENVADTYSLVATDNSGWSPSVLPTSLTMSSGSSGTATLSVTIPSSATGGTVDNIKVTANGTGVSGSSSCTAQVNIGRRISVSISPLSQSGANGAKLTYTVTVSNTGNVSDTYSLAVSDNASPSWSPTVSPTSLTVPIGSSGNATLSVTIPENAISGTSNNITVIATSQTDNTIENSASCIAHAVVGVTGRGVQVTISENSKSGKPGETLDFTVTVKNTGALEDTYDLEATDDAVPSWNPTLDENSLTVLANDNAIAIVSVTVPSGASEGDSTMITVTARSQENAQVENSATCTATATTAPPPPRDILPIAVGGATVVGGAGAVIAILLKKGIIHIPSIRSRFLRLLEGKTNIVYIVPEINGMRRPEGGNEWFK